MDESERQGKIQEPDVVQRWTITRQTENTRQGNRKQERKRRAAQTAGGESLVF